MWYTLVPTNSPYRGIAVMTAVVSLDEEGDNLAPGLGIFDFLGSIKELL